MQNVQKKKKELSIMDLTKTCEFCGKEFNTSIKNKKFCSLTCKEKSRQKKYYQENREKILERQKKHQKKYYQENREEILERQKKHRQENREEILEWQKKYRQENQEKIRELRKKKYYLKHKKNKKCFACGKLFSPSFANEKFCSDSCRKNYFKL